MALSTVHRISKHELMDYLQKSDIPDNASLTLRRNRDDFSLFFYWNDGPASFGETVVRFDAESKFWNLKKVSNRV